MNCPRPEELSAYADCMLAPAAQARLALHLQGCPVCQHQLGELSALQQALRTLQSPTLGFDLASRLEGRLGPRPQRRRFLFWSADWFSWVPAGLAAGVALASGVWLGGLLLGSGAVGTRSASMVRVFDPVPPGGLCAATELCRLTKGMP
ncbi:MAG: anti-sigma factor [Verminephrobacter sp.]|nr:anti-sigma factor [Verminephrobacter sp.]